MKIIKVAILSVVLFTRLTADDDGIAQASNFVMNITNPVQSVVTTLQGILSIKVLLHVDDYLKAKEFEDQLQDDTMPLLDDDYDSEE